MYIQIVEENNYMFRPFSGWAIITLRLEYRRKQIYYNVDIKNGYIQIVEEHVHMYSFSSVIRKAWKCTVPTFIEAVWLMHLQYLSIYRNTSLWPWGRLSL
jgi:hypothetical protein